MGEFSGLNAKEMLHKTLQAIKYKQNEALSCADMQLQLSNIETTKAQRATEVKTQQTKRDTTKVQLDNLQVEVC